ncbi:hypothetical protein HDE68_003533 [Pedobacter cryoconitis]|uniref:GLPGLI family protein n=1 Tax=Pedobacter cryoconitis TaxID=188932 RepID=A0A7W8ZPG4_9SPHI|nr:hypothetical protein [Pedobacter cryoconitis]MBB5637618.1 hypothetical protein [Pedobacter cryoconitis]
MIINIITMLCHLKNTRFLFLALFLLAARNTSSAQSIEAADMFNQQVAIQQQINFQQFNTQNTINQQLTTMSLTGMNNGIPVYNGQYPFEVTLKKDSSKITVHSKIYNDTVLHKTYLLAIDKKFPKSDSRRQQKIYPDQTISISRPEIRKAFTRAVHINGVPTDSCWMFKMITGPISAYSFLSDSEPNFNPATIVAIQLNDGPIVKLNEENLEAIVGRDKDALEIVKKNRFYSAIRKYNKDAENKNN